MEAFWNEESRGFIRIEKIGTQYPRIYILQSPTSKNFAGLRLILKDLKTVLRIIQELKSMSLSSGSIVKQSLSFYSVVTYGKCFAQADGRGVKLDSKEILKLAPIELISEHKRIIDQRNNYVAHGGLKGYEHNPVVAILSPDLENKKILGIQDNMMSLVDIDSQLLNFENLTNFLIDKLELKITKQYRNIKNELDNVDLEKLYDNSIEVPIDKLSEIGVNEISETRK